VRKLGAGGAVMVVIVGTITASGAAVVSTGPGGNNVTPTCSDTWTGSDPANPTAWSDAGNWSSGTPTQGTDACISGGFSVVVQNSPVTVNELSVARGSTLTVGTPGGTTAAVLTVSSALENDGSVIAGPSGPTSGSAALDLGGTIENTGTLSTGGAVTIGQNTVTTVTNAGTVAVAPGGVITVGDASVFTNDSQGVLAFGISGANTSPDDYGRITGGTLTLSGTADPVFDDGFMPASGEEYAVYTGGTVGGEFTTVLHDATADYSHAGEVGLSGGAPATTTSTSVLSSVPTSSLYGENVRFTATVTPSLDSVPPTGSSPTGDVSFFADGSPLGSAPVATGGGVTTASIDSSTLGVGSESITATYSGDLFFDASTAPTVAQVVDKDPSEVTVTATPAHAVTEQQVTFTVTVSAGTSSGTTPPTPLGSVSFNDGGTPIANCQGLGLSGLAPFQVSCSRVFDTNGSQDVTATYSGDSDYLGSTGSVTESVSLQPTTTSLATTSTAVTYGQTVALTATVAPASAVADPTGSVTFTDNGTTTLGSSVLFTSGNTTEAMMLLTTLPVGTNRITATYSGDSAFLPSTTTDGAAVTVDRATTGLLLSGSGSLSMDGQAVTFTATITSTSGWGETGTVAFRDGGTEIGTGAVSAGQATFSTASLSVGRHLITASYEGDGNFTQSPTSSGVIQVVEPSPAP
jgi:large repetitive protein